MKIPKYIIEAAQFRLANNYYTLDDGSRAANLRDAIAGVSSEISKLILDSIATALNAHSLANKNQLEFLCRVRECLTSKLNDLEEEIARETRRADGLEMARAKAREILAKAREEMTALIRRHGLEERDVTFSAEVSETGRGPWMNRRNVDAK